MQTVFADLRGASVFVTGGGSGIGASLVEGFAAQGARVAFADIADAGAFRDAVAARQGTRPLFLPCDVTDPDALGAALEQAAAAHGPVTVLVNNAARDDRHDTLSVDEAYWDEMLDTNLKHVFFASQAVIPGMQAAGGGAIVNLSSISYMLGMSEYPVYTASKAAIVALTRGLARQFGSDGIRVNAIAPGWVLTERQLRLWATPEALAAFLEKQCIPQHLVPEDIVGPALFLASGASRMITGQTIAVDGGVVTVAG